MKRTDGDAFVSITSGHGATVNGFGEGDPTVPTNPSQVKADWLNNLQEELMNILDEASIPASGAFTDLLTALGQLFVSVRNSDAGIAGFKSWTGQQEWEAEGGFDLDQTRMVLTKNSMSARAVHKAHASIVLNSTGTPTVDANDSYNLHSSTPAQCPGGNILRVNFCVDLGGHFLATGALPNVMVTLGDEIGSILIPYVKARTQDSVDIVIRNSTNTLQDPGGAGLNGLRVYVHAEGKQ